MLGLLNTAFQRSAGFVDNLNRRFSMLQIGVKQDQAYKAMTPDESRKLKTGTRVCFNDNQADLGTVTAIETWYVTIIWDDGHQSFSGHNDMNRVELVTTK
jgi:hypothetical protein